MLLYPVKAPEVDEFPCRLHRLQRISIVSNHTSPCRRRACPSDRPLPTLRVRGREGRGRTSRIEVAGKSPATTRCGLAGGSTRPGTGQACTAARDETGHRLVSAIRMISP